MSEIEWVAAFRDVGVIGVLLLFTWAAMTGRLIWEWAHKEIVRRVEESYRARLEDVTKDRDVWRETALRATGTAAKTSTVAQRIVDRAASDE